MTLIFYEIWIMTLFNNRWRRCLIKIPYILRACMSFYCTPSFEMVCITYTTSMIIVVTTPFLHNFIVKDELFCFVCTNPRHHLSDWGAIHKLRWRDFEDFWRTLPLRWQVYYISLYSIVDIWLNPLPITRQRSLWTALDSFLFVILVFCLVLYSFNVCWFF